MIGDRSYTKYDLDHGLGCCLLLCCSYGSTSSTMPPSGLPSLGRRCVCFMPQAAQLSHVSLLNESVRGRQARLDALLRDFSCYARSMCIRFNNDLHWQYALTFHFSSCSNSTLFSPHRDGLDRRPCLMQSLLHQPYGKRERSQTAQAQITSYPGMSAEVKQYQ